MSKRADQKPAAASKPETKSNEPTSNELSPKELDQVAGGMQDFHIVKHVDKSSPKLFLG
jgi:type VI protein secretion system component Hcp